MRYEVRPLGPWLEPQTVDRSRSARFRAPWSKTLELLGREVDYLGGTLIVLQVDVREGDIRRDGMLRADARVGFPGVRVAFQSVHGPLTYATDAYDKLYPGDPPGWQANIRAIALGLEALRAVDRYGVTRRGEQYRGWAAIEAPQNGTMSTQAARDLLAGYGGLAQALKATHPDHGGSTEALAAVLAARKALESVGVSFPA